MGAITFGAPLTMGSGTTPSIAINNQSVVVSVHVESGAVVYRVGKVNKKNRTLQLGSSMPLTRGADKPTIALNNQNLAVCVYEQDRKSIYSVAGFVKADGSIGFGQEKRYDSGVTPSVSLRDDGNALEVHKSESGNGLYCHTGPYTNGNINWGDSYGGDNGQAPESALAGNVACEVHRSESSPSDLYYNVGTINTQKRSCSLSGGTFYYTVPNGSGPSPSLALTSNLIAVEVHDGGGGDTALSYFFGTVNPDKKKITWPDTPTAMNVFGSTPSVAANNDDVVVVAYTRGGQLTYLVGTF
jgi:hypothetical protein